MSLRVTFHGNRAWKIGNLPDLRKAALSVLRAEGATGPVDIVFQSPAEQRALNLQWRGLDRTTDVLSFEYHEPDLFGELYIDPVLAAEQAVRYKHDLHAELRRLVVHGCLHLCGHDHHTSSERVRMRALERKYDPGAGS
ncbi:MAG TPA: rRNA maturation RNase YbeY [Fibrobacteria bacterium]|nr:rRNA maturation RNase YbeY [Fibrobacteria bacterium]